METQHAAAAGAALVALAVWEMAKTYESYAPSMTELRRADRDDVDTRQRLLDADLTVGGLALLVGAAAGIVTRSWMPVALSLGAFAWIAGLRHLVQSSLTPDQIQ